MTKVATGLTEEDLAKMFGKLKGQVITKPHDSLLYKEKNVDVWLNPQEVWEVKCADMTLSPIYCAAKNFVGDKGIALRFPRFIRERPDKTVV